MELETNQNKFQTIENDYITLKDGCKLAYKAWFPSQEYMKDQKIPAILEYLPYRKRDGTAFRDSINHPYFAQNGYACFRVDIRGNGESDGLMEDEYTKQELQDGVEVIEWIGNQNFSNQKVGLMGKSWGGFNALQIAYLQPKYLSAIITVFSSDDRYNTDIHYMGGCLLNDNLTWSQQMLCIQSPPPDPILKKIDNESFLKEMIKKTEKGDGDAMNIIDNLVRENVLQRFKVNSYDVVIKDDVKMKQYIFDNFKEEDWQQIWMYRLKNIPFLLSNWLKHQQKDEFWKHASVSENYSKLQIPIYAVGGWNDGYVNTVQRLYNGIDTKWQQQFQGIIGPWEHQYPHRATIGPRVDFLDMSINFWDKHLKIQNKQSQLIQQNADFKIFLMDSHAPNKMYGSRQGNWIQCNSLPLKQTIYQKYNLENDLKIHEQNQCQLQNKNNQNVYQIPQKLLVGLKTGSFCVGLRIDEELHDNQIEDDNNSLVFQSQILQQDTCIIGTPQISLCIKNLAEIEQKAIIGVRLCDYNKNTNESTLISYQPFNLSNNNGLQGNLKPHQNYYYQNLKLKDIAYKIFKGHQIRVSISISYWPHVWPQAEIPNIGVVAQESELQLPLVDFNSLQICEVPYKNNTFGPFTDFKDTKKPELKSSRYINDKGEFVIQNIDDFGAMRDEEIQLESGEKSTVTYTLKEGDPLSAKCRSEWDLFINYRDQQQIKTWSYTQMTCDKNYFYIKAEIKTYLNGKEFYSNQWDEKIERSLM